MAQGALNQSSNLKDAVNVTKYFQKNIKTVSDEHISKLVKSLALAFANVTYKLNCETKKIQVVNHIYKVSRRSKENLLNNNSQVGVNIFALT